MTTANISLHQRRKTAATNTSVPHSQPQRLIRLPEVCKAVGLRPTAIYELQAAGKFPRSVKLTSRSVAWDSREISQWIAQRLAERDMQ